MRNKQNDWIDSAGIDFLIFLNNGLALPVQIKSARGNLEYKKREHFRKYPIVKTIIFVLLPEEKTDQQERRDLIKSLKKELIKSLKDY